MYITKIMSYTQIGFSKSIIRWCIWKHFISNQAMYNTMSCCNNFRSSGISSFPSLIPWKMLGGYWVYFIFFSSQSGSAQFQVNMVLKLLHGEWMCLSVGSVFYYLAHGFPPPPIPTERYSVCIYCGTTFTGTILNEVGILTFWTSFLKR